MHVIKKVFELVKATLATIPEIKFIDYYNEQDVRILFGEVQAFDYPAVFIKLDALNVINYSNSRQDYEMNMTIYSVFTNYVDNSSNYLDNLELCDSIFKKLHGNSLLGIETEEGPYKDKIVGYVSPITRIDMNLVMNKAHINTYTQTFEFIRTENSVPDAFGTIQHKPNFEVTTRFNSTSGTSNIDTINKL